MALISQKNHVIRQNNFPETWFCFLSENICHSVSSHFMSPRITVSFAVFTKDRTTLNDSSIIFFYSSLAIKLNVYNEKS